MLTNDNQPLLSRVMKKKEDALNELFQGSAQFGKVNFGLSLCVDNELQISFFGYSAFSQKYTTNRGMHIQLYFFFLFFFLKDMLRTLTIKSALINNRTRLFHTSSVLTRKVVATRKLLERSQKRLENQGFELIQWPHDSSMPREKLIRDIKGAEGLICMLSDKIDADVFNAAGMSNKKRSLFF